MFNGWHPSHGETPGSSTILWSSSLSAQRASEVELTVAAIWPGFAGLNDSRLVVKGVRSSNV
jgi:hypothetical protein